jgi:transglutaminase-like putative cysteine protease
MARLSAITCCTKPATTTAARFRLSQQQLHLSPRILAWQQIEEQQIIVDAPPNWRRDGQDAFGNPVTWIAFHAPHDSLRISSAMTVSP